MTHVFLFVYITRMMNICMHKFFLISAFEGINYNVSDKHTPIFAVPFPTGQELNSWLT